MSLAKLAKLKMQEDGQALVERFCRANAMVVPRTVLVSRADWRFPSTCAYYREDVITICVDRCSSIGTAGRQWSYPGHVTDRTPYGVMAHELGHHVDRVRSEAKGAYGGDFSERMRAASGEPKLTSYCPNDWEWFAEMFRLFVTNPDLLRLVRPRTYELLRAHFEPVEERPWLRVLWDAPRRTIEAAAKKAGAVL